ncbi:hypothetical protein [Streptomyces sp. NPDC127036]|uniref:hypothetical protein n=1 Tax=Streptomyces sp. NPDC127036 TaxID=3347112 RepID=UPI00364F66EA
MLTLSSGLMLRPLGASDAGTLIAAGQDPAIRQWNLLLVASPAETGKRIERMHDRWLNEQSAIRTERDMGHRPSRQRPGRGPDRLG